MAEPALVALKKFDGSKPTDIENTISHRALHHASLWPQCRPIQHQAIHPECRQRRQSILQCPDAGSDRGFACQARETTTVRRTSIRVPITPDRARVEEAGQSGSLPV